MFQLVYLSFAEDDFNAEDPERGIDNILQVARQYNADHGVTGMLLYKGGVFLQILEGPRDQIETLYGKICMDLRHFGHKVLVKQDAQERIFPEWTMAYRKVDDITGELINTILPWQQLVEQTRANKKIPKEKILEVLKQFRFQLGK